MSTPLVTIDLSEYNALIKKRDINEMISDIFSSSSSLLDFQQKIAALSVTLSFGDTEIKVQFSATRTIIK